ncbi:antibiotic biosynthesis monooxygenase [Algoriphagus sp.]|uniref:putative quinol monooxygenase n=1 Tax=Algoriphagus sp. TaxID=1872435 RepID=UPI0025F8B823|nr:antibiotic biosynthesis monooxygenase [Algoriphagus sp.]
MYSLTGKWTMLSGKEKKATAELKKLAMAVNKKEPGTLLYMIFTPDYQEKNLPNPPPGEVVFFEIYKDKDAFEKHINGPIFTNFIKKNSSLFLTDFSNINMYITVKTLSKLEGFVRAGIT